MRINHQTANRASRQHANKHAKGISYQNGNTCANHLASSHARQLAKSVSHQCGHTRPNHQLANHAGRQLTNVHANRASHRDANRVSQRDANRVGQRDANRVSQRDANRVSQRDANHVIHQDANHVSCRGINGERRRGAPPQPKTLLIGDSVVRDVWSKSIKAFCFPRVTVCEVIPMIPRILHDHPAMERLIVHVGSSDVYKQQSETLKQDFNHLFDILEFSQSEVFISGPIPTARRGSGHFTRLLSLNSWLATTCAHRKKHDLEMKEAQLKTEEIRIKTMKEKLRVETDIAASIAEIRDVIPVSKENVISSKDLEKWPYLRNVDIKEIDADVELLIGVNTPKAMEPWEIINSIGNGPYAVRTMLGWIVNGPLGSMGDVTNHHVVTTNRISVSEIEELLIKQYNQEFPETHYTEKREMSLDDKKFMKILTEQVTYENSHYYLPLPFRNDNVMMPNNREVAIRRAASLAKRLKGDKSFQAEYKQFMDKMLEQDYAEKIPLDQLHVVEGKIWYVPHHGVYHRRKGTLRVVFDCTSSFQNTSLNKELLQGPDLTNNLLGVLMRFRQGHIALMADIQAMFHQVRVHRTHVDFLRFLWWPDGDFEKQPEDYRMKVHLFGAISSPSCANFALQKTAQDNQHNYDKEVIETIQNNFYVDDCLKTADTEMHAIKLHKGLSDLCSTGGFKLTKWVSNSKKVLEVTPENERADMTWLQDTEHLSGLRINRCMKPKGFGTVISAQLHHFCDASEVGYGTVSYIRFASDRNVHVSFVVGKARVVPLKQMTIPRLELQAATLASRMDKMLRVELQMNLEPSVIWTESQSVLKDINNEQTRFSTFVTNRLTVIRDLTTKEQWRYVGSANNPADAASRAGPD
ncbi:hypothetical protein SRHO_G00340060 [Serrasalmus rhombeus]